MSTDDTTTKIDADTLNTWRVEATAERRRAGLKNIQAFRVQAMADEGKGDAP